MELGGSLNILSSLNFSVDLNNKNRYINNMKNKIKVCVYDSSSNVLLLEKDFKEVFKLESLYKWMSKSKEILDLIGEGVECEWNEKELKFKNKLYGYKLSLEDSFCYMRFINVDIKL